MFIYLFLGKYFPKQCNKRVCRSSLLIVFFEVCVSYLFAIVILDSINKPILVTFLTRNNSPQMFFLSQKPRKKYAKFFFSTFETCERSLFFSEFVRYNSRQNLCEICLITLIQNLSRCVKKNFTNTLKGQYQ
jgi:hypothetical protein